VDPDRRREELARALQGLEPETRQALERAIERKTFELEGGGWGDMTERTGCILSLAAWELGLADGEQLMYESVDAVRVPALFDAWWNDVLTREGDVVRARRSVRDAVRDMLRPRATGPWPSTAS
jgi:hypothetical protein